MAKIYEYIRIDIDTGEVTDEVSYNYDGPMMMCGGGTSGSFDFPGTADAGVAFKPTVNYTYIVEALKDMYTAYYPATGEVGAATGGGADTPFTDEESPDPDTYMGATGTQSQARMNTDLAIIDALDEDTDFGTYADAALAKADDADMFPAISVTSDVDAVHTAERTDVGSALTAALTSAADVVAGTPIAAMVTAYEVKIRKQYVRAMSRISSGFADINAVNSSAYVFALASIERQMIEDVDQYEAQLDIEAYRSGFAEYMNTFRTTFAGHLGLHSRMNVLRKSNRDMMILGGVKDISSMLGMKLQANSTAVQMQAEINRIRHASKVEEHQNQLAIDELDIMFPHKFATMAGNVLATAGGAAMVPDKMTKTQSVVSGMASGAAIGASVGGPVTAGIGAGIGALAGLFNE